MLKLVSRGIFILFFYTVSLCAYGDSPVGMIVAAKGTVTVNTDNESRVVKQGDNIFTHDIVEAYDKSFAVIQLSDGSKVTVRPRSSVEVEDYSYQSDNTDRVALNLLSGGLRVITGVVAKTNPENYTVQTNVALLGVRGTEFSVEICGTELCTSE